MRYLSARRLVLTCIIAVASAAALVAPGAASATTLGEQCTGSAIGGQGSSLQLLAQEVWIANFNTSSNKFACNGSQGKGGTPKINTYNPSGSGAGLRSFGVKSKESKEINYSATNAYVGTDEAPNPTAITEIEAHESTITPKTVLTIPVLQAAVAVIVHLPEGCTATSTSNKGRLVLNNSTLEEIWRGNITNWTEIKDGGDAFTGTCSATIKHAVRLDGSGTTHIFKKYLGLINKTTAWPATNLAGESVGSKTWNEVAEGTENTTWPTADAVIRPAKTGGGALVSLVAAEPSTIGYANMADARVNAAFVPPAGGPKTSVFWVPIQDKTGTVTYADPATNKEVAAKKESNCGKEEYTDGVHAFPPESALVSWSEVTTNTEEPKYTICGLTFDIAFTSYGLFTGASLEETTTVNNYLQYVLQTTKEKEGNKNNGGQALIKLHDFEPLGGTVLKEAQKGAALVRF
jgi:ABC-type phosphate transport system substrate-binding protein